MAEFTIKCPVIVCTQTAHETKSHGIKCIKETNFEWPVESDIGPARDMSEIATENKFYFVLLYPHGVGYIVLSCA